MSAFDPSAPFEVVEEDIEYARPQGTPLLARVYRPVDAGGACPALVDVHGGAWTHFDRRADFYFDRALAACGMVVVALDFRQGPAHRYPSAIADVVAGVRWTKTHADDVGATPDRVGLIGGSSGGHIAMLAALRPTAPEFTTTRVAGADGIDARVDYALPLWPILDPLARYRYLRERRR
jgi:acetyl esterase/lipase